MTAKFYSKNFLFWVTEIHHKMTDIVCLTQCAQVSPTVLMLENISGSSSNINVQTKEIILKSAPTRLLRFQGSQKNFKKANESRKD